jgi:hypothetical protein
VWGISLQTLEKSVVEDHPGARVTVALWKCTCGNNSEERLKREVLSCLPCKARPAMKKDTSKAKLEELSRSKLFSFLSLGPKALFTTAERFVLDLNTNMKPKFDTAKNSQFMQDVMAACEYWLQCPKDGSSAAITLRGKDAASVLFKNLTKSAVAKTLVADRTIIRHLKMYGWLMTDVQRDQLDAFENAIAAENMEAQALARMHEGPGAKRKARAKTQPTGRSAVLAMLGSG